MSERRSIFKQFQELTDPRVNRGKNHSLYEMVVIALTATLCGANFWTDVERFGNSKITWFRKFLTLEHGIPSHDTFGRLFAKLDTNEFLTCLQNWLQTWNLDMQGQGVAIDGKTLRRSFDKATGTGALHVVNAWATGQEVGAGSGGQPNSSQEVGASQTQKREIRSTTSAGRTWGQGELGAGELGASQACILCRFAIRPMLLVAPGNRWLQVRVTRPRNLFQRSVQSRVGRGPGLELGASGPRTWDQPSLYSL